MGVSESDSVVANAVPTIPSAGAANESSSVLSGQPAPAVSGTAAIAATPGALSGPGKATVRSASVAVPRSYFEKAYMRASSNSSIQPDDALLQPIVNDHAAKIRALVKNSLGLESDAAVTVEAFDDGITIAGFAPLPGGNAPAAASAIQNPALLLNAHAKEIALVMMGIVVLLVLSMTFRRSPAPAAATASPAAVTRPAGAATRERHGLLEGEIDEEPQTAAPPTVHVTHEQEAHQLFRRVRDMVSDNPKDAARVLQDWIYEDR